MNPVSTFPASVFGAITAVALVAGCSSPRGSALQRYEFSRPEMGVECRVVLYAETSETARTAALAALDRIRQLNLVFSDYEEESELALLSRSSGSGREVPVSPELWDVLSQAQELAVRTHGAFDITVGPYVNLWRHARLTRQLPRSYLHERAAQSVGWTNLVLIPRQRAVHLNAPRMRLDLGGIAKGWALDEALRVLRRHHVRSALVSAGGDLVVSDAPPGRAGWRVELTSPEDADSVAPVSLLVRHRAVATSGDLFQHVDIDGVRYSHVVDPRTGVALTNRSLVTVIAKSGAEADSLSTAVGVLGPEDGLRLIRSVGGAQARVVLMEGSQPRTSESDGFGDFIAPVAVP